MFVIVTNPRRIKIVSTKRYKKITAIKVKVYKMIDVWKYCLVKWIKINSGDIKITNNIMLIVIFFMSFVSAKSNLTPQEHLFGIIPNLIFTWAPQFMQYSFFIPITSTTSNWTKSLRDGLPRLWHSDFLFSITKQWKASPKSSIVKSPQNNNQTGSTSPLPMKRIPPFHLVGKRFYDPNAPPYKAVFLITTDFIWRILLCMKNI